MSANITGKINISDKCVCLVVEFAAFGNTRSVREELFDVDANKSRTKLKKTLLDSPELKAITKHDGFTRNWLYTRCLSSVFKGGVYILPNGLLEQVDNFLIQRALERAELVKEAAEAYPQRVKESASKDELGALYEKKDYPELEEFEKQFEMNWRYMAFHVPNSLASVRKEIFEREQEKAQKAWKNVTVEVTALLRAEMGDLIKHMVDRLTPDKDGKEKTFKSTLIGESEKSYGNITDFLNTFEARNIADDKELKKLVDKARGLLTGVDNADELRDNAKLKAKLAVGMGAIKGELDKLVTKKPSRAYDFGE